MSESNTPAVPGIARGALLYLVLAGACAYHPGTSEGPARPVTVTDITAPGGTAEDLQALRGLGDSHAVLLRRAWILKETRRNRAAVRLCNQVLFHRHSPTRSMETLALLIRGDSFRQLGDIQRARQDLDKARAMALDASLKRRVDTALAAVSPKPTAAPAAGPKANPASVASLRTRQSWSARPAIRARLDPMGGIDKVTIHHSADLCRSSPAAVKAHLRILQRYHIEGQGWGDIGYHFLIDPAGRIWTGRELRYQGAHAKGWRNKHNVGICLLGNFVNKPGGNHPSDAQILAMTQLVRALQSKYHIPASGIKTHKELVSSTECPGPRLQPIVDRFRARLAAEGSGTSRLLAGREDE